MCLGLVLSKINMIEVDFPCLSLVLELFSRCSEFIVGSLCLVKHHQLLNYKKMYLFLTAWLY